MIFFSHKCGQLGNRLFSFGHIIANASAHNLKVVNLAFDEYAKYFKTTSQDVLCRYPPAQSVVNDDWLRAKLFLINKAILKLLRIIKIYRSPIHEILDADLPVYTFKEDRFCDLNESKLIHLTKTKTAVFLFGRFFRDYRNFEKYQDTIRDYFKPIQEIEDSIKPLIQKGKRDSDFLVGVHMRRGDYQMFADGKYFYDQQQYLTKMKELKDSLPGKRINFLVCSNEQIELASTQDFDILKGTGHIVEDMYMLAGCDFIMGPPSTYTLWASFYGNKPLCQLKNLQQVMTLDSFTILPTSVLYNFSFN